MDRLIVRTVSEPIRKTVAVPGSKSITNRALILAAMGSHRCDCTLSGALQSEDTEVMIQALKQLGFAVDDSRLSEGTIQIPQTHGDVIPAKKADLFLANSGTSIRFLTALTSLGTGRYRLDGIERMRERPIQDLLDALQSLGVNARSEMDSGCPPVVVESKGLPGGEVSIRGDVSSQFLSALLMVAPLTNQGVQIHVKGELVSKPYVEMTTKMMQSFGATVDQIDESSYRIPGQQKYECERYAIEPDASAASYFFAAAAITQGEVTVEGLNESSLQGDIEFVRALEVMGCEVSMNQGTTCHWKGSLRGVDLDMNAISDTVMTLGAVACFADGPTTMRNIGHIRHKETDRLAAMANELRRIGVRVEEKEDAITVIPGPMHGAEIETYNDHRMAMSFALIGLRVPGIVIKDPKCVGKTFPRFFEVLEQVSHGNR